MARETSERCGCQFRPTWRRTKSILTLLRFSQIVVVFCVRVLLRCFEPVALHKKQLFNVIISIMDMTEHMHVLGDF